jgi:hypothetical protein
MGVAYVKYAELDRQQMAKLKALEQELGSWVVAVQPEAKIAELDPDKLKRLQEAERELGVILLAYKQA